VGSKVDPAALAVALHHRFAEPQLFMASDGIGE
jgi:hypothetical protein